MKARVNGLEFFRPFAKLVIVVSILFSSQFSLGNSKFVGGYESSSGGNDLWVLLENNGVQILFGLYANLKWEALVGVYDSRTNTTAFDSQVGLPAGFKITITAYWTESNGKISGQLRATSCTYYNGPCANVRDNSLIAFISKIFDS